MKRVFSICFILLILLSGFVLAQLDGIESGLDSAKGNLEGNVTAARDFTTADKWTFIGAQWKELLLKNKFVASFNNVFTKLDPVLFILFSRHWSFSLEMFFWFLLWLTFFLSAYAYSSLSTSNSGYRWLISFVSMVIFSWMQILNFAAKGILNAFLYKKELLWRITSFALIIVFILAFYVVNNVIKKNMQKRKERERQRNLELKVKKEEAFIKGIKKGL